MGHRKIKDQIYEQFSRIGKAIASPQRIEIVDLLAQGERTVEGVAKEHEPSYSLQRSSRLPRLHVVRDVPLCKRGEGLSQHISRSDESIVLAF